jgi:phosphatidylinositol kinase/protein kinase (PI-3  family)
VFKNCCEATTDLLKASKEQIMTIFEVFLYDPLYNWSLTPKKALQLQQTSVLSDSPILTGMNSAVSIHSADSIINKLGNLSSNQKSSNFIFLDNLSLR